MVTGFEALSKKAYPVIIYDSRFSHFYRMVSFYVAFNVVRFQMSWLFLACCFQRATFSNLHPGFDDVIFNVVCCSMLPGVRPRFGCSSQLSAKFGSLAGISRLTADFSYLVQKSDLTAKCDCLARNPLLGSVFSCLAGISVLSPISGNLVKYSHLSPVFPCLVRNSSLSANLGILAGISHLSSVFPCLVILSCILQHFKQNSSRLSADFACYLHISVQFFQIICTLPP